LMGGSLDQTIVEYQSETPFVKSEQSDGLVHQHNHLGRLASSGDKLALQSKVKQMVLSHIQSKSSSVTLPNLITPPLSPNNEAFLYSNKPPLFMTKQSQFGAGSVPPKSTTPIVASTLVKGEDCLE